MSVAQGLLGVKPGYKGLQIDPCIPKDWPGFSVTRRFCGVEYRVTVQNPDGVNCGVKSLVVNGKPVEGDIIPLAGAGPVAVVVTLG